MKNTTITISYDSEKLSALKLYLEERGANLEAELIGAVDALYEKRVPAGVRSFIALRSGKADPPAPKVKRKPKAEEAEISEALKCSEKC